MPDPNFEMLMMQMQGLQTQQTPAPFMRPNNQPLRRWELSSYNTVQPNFQAMGLGAMGAPAQMGFAALGNMLMQRTGMTMTPAGGAATTYMRAIQQQNDIQALQSIANKQDFNRVRSVVSAFTSATYKGQDQGKIDVMTNSMTRDYMKLLDTGLGQMLGLEDVLAPGGLSGSFATRMYQAGMGRRTGPGRMGLGVEDVMGITKALQGRMFQQGPGGRLVEDTGFTRGFNMREFGEMAIGMSQRGALDINKNKDKMMGQFKDMAGALSALKDLMGTPDAPVNELLSTLDDMFGGGAIRNIPAARLENMVRSAQNFGRTMGLTNEALANVMQGATQQAQGLGMQGELGAISAIRAMPLSTAAQQLTEEEAAQPGGRIRLGTMSPKERMQRAQETVLRTTNSEFSDRLAAAMKMRNMAGGKLRGSPELDKMDLILGKIEAGKIPTTAESQWLFENTHTGQFEQHMEKAGFDPQTTARIKEDKLGLQEEKANYNLAPTELRAFRAQAIQDLGARMEGSQLVSTALGLDQMEAGEARSKEARQFISSMMEAKMTPEGLRSAIREDKRVQQNMGRIIADFKKRGREVNEDQVVAMMEAQLRSSARMTLPKNMVGERAWEGFQAGFSQRSLNRQDILTSENATQVAVDEAMSRVGFGQARTGVGGMMQNFLKAVATGGPDANIEQLAATTLGGIPSSKLVEVMSGGAVGGKVKEMQDLTSSIKSLTEQITKSEGAEREKLVAQRAEKESALAGVVEGLRDLQAFLKPEQAAAATQHGFEAMEIEAAAESGDKAEMSKMARQYATMDIAKTLSDTKGLSTEEQGEYRSIMVEIQKKAAEIASDPAKAEANLKEIAKLKRRAQAIMQKSVDRPSEEELKRIEEQRLKNQKQEEEAQKIAEAEQSKQKDIQQEATASPTPMNANDSAKPQRIPQAPMQEQIKASSRDAANNSLEEWTFIRKPSI